MKRTKKTAQKAMISIGVAQLTSRVMKCPEGIELEEVLKAR